MEADTYTKLVPTPNQDTQPYWDGLNEQRLMLQQCTACAKVRHYPRPVCPHCHAMDAAWIEASGKGIVHTWTIAHHPFHVGFKGEVPYTLVTVDLAEGVRMQAQLQGTPAGDLAVGLPVEVRYAQAKPGLTLPYFVRS